MVLIVIANEADAAADLSSRRRKALLSNEQRTRQRAAGSQSADSYHHRLPSRSDIRNRCGWLQGTRRGLMRVKQDQIIVLLQLHLCHLLRLTATIRLPNSVRTLPYAISFDQEPGIAMLRHWSVDISVYCPWRVPNCDTSFIMIQHDICF